MALEALSSLLTSLTLHTHKRTSHGAPRLPAPCCSLVFPPKSNATPYPHLFSTLMYLLVTAAVPGVFLCHKAAIKIARHCIPGSQISPPTFNHTRRVPTSPAATLAPPKRGLSPENRTLAVPRVTIVDWKAESDCLLRLSSYLIESLRTRMRPVPTLATGKASGDTHPHPLSSWSQQTRQPWRGFWTHPWSAVVRLAANGVLFLLLAHTLCRKVDSAPGLCCQAS